MRLNESNMNNNMATKAPIATLWAVVLVDSTSVDSVILRVPRAILAVSQSSRHGQDYEAELNLTLRDVTTTHKQVISIGDKSLRVTIPAGVHDGQRLKLRGHGGEAAEGGTRGDLYITFRIAPDAVFTRQGDDLYTTVPISLTTAVLGGNVALTTLMGETLRLKVSAGTQPDTKVRLKGKGMPVYKKTNERGDLIVTYSLIIPTALTSEQKELFERLQQLSL